MAMLVIIVALFPPETSPNRSLWVRRRWKISDHNRETHGESRLQHTTNAAVPLHGMRFMIYILGIIWKHVGDPSNSLYSILTSDLFITYLGSSHLSDF